MGQVVAFARPHSSSKSVPNDATGLILACLGENKPDPARDLSAFGRSLSKQEHKKNTLDRIDQIRHLVEQERIDDFLFVARDLETKHFLTEVPLMLSNETEIFSFVGVLSALKLELTERSQLAPALMLDGTVNDPNANERLP